MPGRTLLTRYLPLAAIAAIQVLIIAIAPSKSPAELAQFGGPGGSASGDFGGDLDFSGGDPFAATDTTGTGGVGGSGTGGVGGTGTGGGGGGGGTRTGAPPGSTAHCVNGRQFDPAIWAYAPECVPLFGGSNGGTTYRGVTEDKIHVVLYDANLGAAVDALLTAQGSNPTDEEIEHYRAGFQDFINQNFELYGRQIEIRVWHGECVAVPPNYPCLRNEMRQIVQSEPEPFWVVWNTSLASPAFDELSQLRVMNSGGWGFRDSFNVQRRPFHWDLLKGGSQQVKDVAEWWCKRMHGHNARYAGEFGTGEGQNKHADIRAQTRVLGVISTDDPENKLSIAEFKQHLNSTCGASVAHEYYYAQDITTAEQQRREAVNAMRTPPPESTTIMCFCDLVAPIFLYQTCEENQYYPEHVVVGTGFMDADPAAQAYDTTLGPGHQFENAFGLAQQPRLRNFKTDNDAARAFKATGREDYPHESSVAPFNYLGMVASLIEAAGPNLNPQTVEANATKLAIAPGSNADPYYNQRSFNPAAGDYTWIDTMREVFWSKQQTSEHNGEPGTYITLNQGAKVWFSAGQYPSGELTSIPPKPR